MVDSIELNIDFVYIHILRLKHKHKSIYSEFVGYPHCIKQMNFHQLFWLFYQYSFCFTRPQSTHIKIGFQYILPIAIDIFHFLSEWSFFILLFNQLGQWYSPYSNNCNIKCILKWQPLQWNKYSVIITSVAFLSHWFLICFVSWKKKNMNTYTNHFMKGQWYNKKFQLDMKVQLCTPFNPKWVFFGRESDIKRVI